MRNFSQMIQNLRSSESALYDALVETVGYIHFQYHKNGRKVDANGNAYWPQLVAAIQTKWIADKIGTLEPKGKRVVVEDETQAMMMVAPEVSRILNERKAQNVAAQIKRAQTRAAQKEAERKARVEAYKAETAEAPLASEVIEGEFESVSIASGLIFNGEVIELSTAEAQALMDTLQAMRAAMQAAPMLRAA